MDQRRQRRGDRPHVPADSVLHEQPRLRHVCPHLGACDVRFWRVVRQYQRLAFGRCELDVFVFLGTPKKILNEYPTLTGKPPMPPLWSFGLWMSRITYYSEDETRAVAAK